MNRRTVGIVLLVAGILVFFWAMSQISNLPPAFMMPARIVQQNKQREAAYRVVQVVSAAAAVGGGVLLVYKGKSS